MTKQPLQSRIVEALKLEPMTAREVSTRLSAGYDSTRLVMGRLEQLGRIRRIGFGERTAKSGATPYLWRAA
ncbi:MAG: hypothetical protein GAK28_00152 [Luteibacter sp.]|uniref:hypothetical protein n=1 Tax=Luteibacter sp. TaxID=1886636 RepID=UPI00137F4425|nr:hypothetical protein [Luteibacter sp.]KAF1009514.1 MAG: hypothetical protein GAK28_00152 [Luteibacter sp.]